MALSCGAALGIYDGSRAMIKTIFKIMLIGVLAAVALICLLYTSDAADERSSVDLGGRRIIKKKKYIKREEIWSQRTSN